MERDLRIIYMGTPEFAVEPLRAIINAGYKVLAVVTAPDKPAGRGQKLQHSAVKEFALEHGLEVLQPVSLKNPEFISELKSYKTNLQVVVAFRMLPEIVWQMPEYGTLNLHASLLPQYRGAAPINHAIINGETQTGLTTFFIEKEIDTGNILRFKEMPILPEDNAGILHDKLMIAGGELMLETLRMIGTGNVEAKSQQSLITQHSSLKAAPKIFKNDCKINWDKPCESIHNLVRGLAPFPCAFTNFITQNGEQKQIKIYRTSLKSGKTAESPGTIISDQKKILGVVCRDGTIMIEELQMEGKKRMNTSDFLRGIKIEEYSGE